MDAASAIAGTLAAEGKRILSQLRRLGALVDIEWVGAGLLPVGAWALRWHPYGLLVIAAGLLLLLVGRRSFGDWEGGQGRNNAERGPRPLAMALVALGLAAGTIVTAGLFSPIVQPERWPWMGAWAGLSLIALLGASFAQGREWPLRRGLRPRPGRSAGASFWIFCLLAAGWSRGWAVAGTAGLAGALLLAPGDGLEQDFGRPRWVPWALLVTLGLGLVLHLWHLGRLPQGLNAEEFYTLDVARPVIEGEAQSLVHLSDSFSGLTLYHHAVGWVYRALQARDVVPLRLISVLGWGVLSVYGTLLAGSLFSWPAAFGTAAYFSASFLALHFGRFGFYFIWAPAVVAAVLAHSVWALRSRRTSVHLALAALWSGASLYGWISGFVAPLVPCLYLATALGRDRESWRALVRAAWPAAAVFITLAVPAVLLHAQMPGGPLSLFGGHSGSLFQAQVRATGMDLSSSLLLHLDELLHTGTAEALHYLPGLPVFRWSVLVLAVAGATHLFRRPWAATTVAVLGTLFLGFLPLWISDPEGRNLGRMIVMLLPVGLLFGAGLQALLASLRDRTGRPWMAAALSASCLALTLGAEPWEYFHIYQLDRSAILSNHGASAYLGRRIREQLDPDTDFYFSQRYNEAYFTLFQLPRRARRTPLRGAPDFLRLFAQSPKGMVMASGIHEDWLAWLRRFAPDISVLEVENPWGEHLFSGKHHFLHLDHPGLLAPLIAWSKPIEGIGFVPDGPGRWRGQLWVGRSDDYRLSLSSGTLLLAGRHRLASGQSLDLRLSSVPYELLVTESPERPVLTAVIPLDARQEEWAHPVVNGVPMEGLRRTLSGIGGRASGPLRVSLKPVVSQRFSIWSYESDETNLRFPFQGWWEGWVHVPISGDYRFECPSNFSGELTMQVGGRTAYRMRSGEASQSFPMALKAGQDHELSIHASRIDYDRSMHLMVQGPDGRRVAVPTAWLRPAPMPGPVLLAKGKP